MKTKDSRRYNSSGYHMDRNLQYLGGWGVVEARDLTVFIRSYVQRCDYMSFSN